MLLEYDLDSFSNIYKDLDSSALGVQLARLQRKVKNLDIPVLVIIDGWESSGKGHVIKELIRELDPRSFKVSDFENSTDEEKARPFLWRFWNRIPRKGSIAIFDRSFYYKIMDRPKMDRSELQKDIMDICSIEKMLYNSNMIIIKFFLHEKEKTQKRRIEELINDRFRSFFVTNRDKEQNADYKTYLKHFDMIMKLSDFPYSPWIIVNTEDKGEAVKYVLGTAIDKIQAGIDRIMASKRNSVDFTSSYMTATRPLSAVDLGITLEEAAYKEKLKRLQEEAKNIAYELYEKRISCVLVFEGMDAAGKGGAIQRLTRLIDPRLYEVVPVSAPDETEKQYHYLWRFIRNLPKSGNMAVFDRSWYGRVLVERVEGFAAPYEWEQAYEEINDMERHMHNFGTLVLKFFLCIDKAEQLKRFKDREAEADKLYKITEEDWRNREKWDSYLEAMNEMLVRTNTEYAPWIILSGQDKKYARIRVLEEFVRHGKQAINK